MKIAIHYGTRGHPDEPYECWIANGHDEDRCGWLGEGDTPSEAMRDLLQHKLEAGNRSPELLAMISAENDAAMVRSEP